MLAKVVSRRKLTCYDDMMRLVTDLSQSESRDSSSFSSMLTSHQFPIILECYPQWVNKQKKLLATQLDKLQLLGAMGERCYNF